MKIRLAAPLQTHSYADGKGIRMVIWNQGCKIACPGCHNPETHSMCGGKEVDIENLEKEISDALDLLKIGYDKTADLWQDLMADAVLTSYARQAAKEAYEALDDDQAIILFGFKECKWCKNYVPILNEVVKENNVPQVYYCNIKEDRAKNTEEYKKLIEKLEKR